MASTIDTVRFDASLGSDVDQLVAVMDATGTEQADLIGYSFGAPPAAEFAARFPDRVGRIVFYSGFARGSAITTRERRGPSGTESMPAPRRVETVPNLPHRRIARPVIHASSGRRSTPTTTVMRGPAYRSPGIRDAGADGQADPRPPGSSPVSGWSAT